MHRVSQGDFGELKRGIKRLAQGHVQHVAGERELVIRAILAVNVDTFRVKDVLDLLEKRGIHERGLFRKQIGLTWRHAGGMFSALTLGSLP